MRHTNNKKLRFKQINSLLLIFCILVSMLPELSLPAKAADTQTRTTALDLTLTSIIYTAAGGTEKTANPTTDNITDCVEGWVWYKTAADGYAANTLVLNGLYLSTAEATALKLPTIATTGVKIIFIGENTIESTIQATSGSTYGVYIGGILTVEGPGTLNAIGGNRGSGSVNSYGLYSGGAFTVNGGTINANSGNTTNSNYGLWVNAAFTMNNGEINATAGNGATSYGLRTGTFTTYDGIINAQSGSVTGSTTGIHANGNFIMYSGSVTARAGSTSGYSSGFCSGIYLAGSNFIVYGGMVNAYGGNSTGTGSNPISTAGVYGSNSITVIMNGGTLNAVSGNSTGTGTGSVIPVAAGIYGATTNTYGITMNGGTLFASGGVSASNKSYGLYSTGQTTLTQNGGVIYADGKTSSAGAASGQTITSYNAATVAIRGKNAEGLYTIEGAANTSTTVQGTTNRYLVAKNTTTPIYEALITKPDTRTLYYDSATSKLYSDADFTTEATNTASNYPIPGWSGNGDTLTLNNFGFITSAETALVMPSGAEIELAGMNTITAATDAVKADGDLTIHGNGMLSTSGGTGYGFYIAGGFTVKGGNTIYAKGGTNAMAVAGTIHSTFDIKGKDGSSAYTVNGHFNHSTSPKTIVATEGEAAITDAKLVKMDVHTLYYDIGESAFFDAPESGDEVEGLIGWRGNGGTLTLTDFNFNTTLETAMVLPDGVTLVLNGNNSVASLCGEGSVSYGIKAEGALTVEGTGTITASGGGADLSYGLYIEGELDVNGGAVYGIGSTDAAIIGDIDHVRNSILGKSGASYTVSAKLNNDTQRIIVGKDGTPITDVQIMPETRTLYYNNSDGKLHYDSSSGPEVIALPGWSASGNTLTLTGFNYITPAAIALSVPASTTISVSGTNELKSIYSGGIETVGIYGAGALTVSGGGELTASGGIVNGPSAFSCGIKTGGTFAVNSLSVVNANGGPAPNSVGIYAVGAVNIPNTGGEIYAAGSDATIGSYGIYTAQGGSVSSTTYGKIYAIGGNAGTQSFGIYNSTGNYSLTVYSGEVYAAAGDAATKSCGMYISSTFTLSGGTVSAKGRHYAIQAGGSAVSSDVVIKGKDEFGGHTIDGMFISSGSPRHIVRKDDGATVITDAILARKETTPAFTITYSTDPERITTTVTGAYQINGDVDFTAVTGTMYCSIATEWFGTTVSIVKKGGANTLDSDTQSLVIPARPAAPTAPTGDIIKITGVTSSMQYRLKGNTSWTNCSGTTVTGLAAGEYEVRLRYNGTTFASEIKTVTVLPLVIPAMPNASIDYEGEKLIGLTENAAYSIDSTDYTADGNGTIVITGGWFNTTLSIVLKGDGITTANSSAQDLPIPERPATPTTPVGGVNRITGVNAAMEYKLSSNTTWADCGDITVTGLTAGTYEVRTKAVTGISFASNAKTVAVSDPGKETTPSAAIDYVNEWLTGLASDVGYTIGGTDYMADASGNISIDSGWFGMMLDIIKKGNGETTTDSDPQSLWIPACPAAPTTPVGNVNKITGVTTSMEYKLSGVANWTDCGSTTITGLVADTYEVRAKAVAGSSFASVAKTVTVSDPGKENTPTAAIDYVGERLTGLAANAGYTIDGTAYTANASGNIAIINDWLGMTLSIVRNGDGITTTDSDVQSLVVPIRPAAPSPAKTDTTGGSANGTITNVDTTMEYRLSGGSWMSCTGTTITGLASGTYEVRVKAVAGASFTGDCASIIIAASTNLTGAALYYNSADGKLYTNSTFTTEVIGLSGWSGNGNTLTLTDFSFTTSAANALVMPSTGSIIILSGTNTLKSTYSGTMETSGIQANGDLTLQGNGTLYTTGGIATSTGNAGYSNGLNVLGSLTMYGCTVYAAGGTSANGSIGLYAITFSMNSGTLSATGGSAPGSFGVFSGTFYMNGGTATAEGGNTTNTSNGLYLTNLYMTDGATIYAKGKTNAASLSGNTSNSILIEGKDGSGDYTIDSQFMTSGQRKIIIAKDGGASILDAKFIWFDSHILYLNTNDGEPHYGSINGPTADTLTGWSYDDESGVLTLEDFSYTAPSSIALRLPYDEDVTIELKGTNTITSTYDGNEPSFGIKAANTNAYGSIVSGNTGSLTIRGDGTLNVYGGTSSNTNGECSDGLCVGGDLTIDTNGTINLSGGIGRTSSYGLFVGGTFNMNNGTVNTTAGNSTYGSNGINSVNFNMNGGTIYAANDNTTVSTSNYGVIVRGNFNMSDGTVYSKSQNGTAFRVDTSVTLPTNAEVRGSGEDNFTDENYIIEAEFDNSSGRFIAVEKDDSMARASGAVLTNVRIRLPGALAYTVTLTVNKNNSSWDSHDKTFYLKQAGTEIATGSGTDSTVTFADVPDGVYHIFDGNKDTGVTVEVNGGDVTASLDYYTVTLTITGGNSTDKVTLGGNDYTSGTSIIVLKDTTLHIVAVPDTARKVSAYSDSVESEKATSDTAAGYTTSAITAARAITVTFDDDTATYAVTVTIRKDDSSWEDHGKTFYLCQSGAQKATLLGTGADLTATVTSGTYEIYEDVTNTEITLTVNAGSGSAFVDYYTVQFRVVVDIPDNFAEIAEYTNEFMENTTENDSEATEDDSEATEDDSDTDGHLPAEIPATTESNSHITDSMFKMTSYTLEMAETAQIGSESTDEMENSADAKEDTYGDVNGFQRMGFMLTSAITASISATYGGSSISTGNILLGGKNLLVTVTCTGADDYTYVWSGAGTNNETTALLTIINLTSPVNALCTVTTVSGGGIGGESGSNGNGVESSSDSEIGSESGSGNESSSDSEIGSESGSGNEGSSNSEISVESYSAGVSSGGENDQRKPTTQPDSGKEDSTNKPKQPESSSISRTTQESEHHGCCFWHWLILLTFIIYVIIVIFRKEKKDKKDDTEEQKDEKDDANKEKDKKTKLKLLIFTVFAVLCIIFAILGSCWLDWPFCIISILIGTAANPAKKLLAKKDKEDKQDCCD